MRCTPGARLALILVLAFAPAARADEPLGPGAPCKTPPDGEIVADVTSTMVFESGFPVAKGCTKLCKKARATCAKHVNRAITCARKNADDSAFFQVKVACAGMKGSALKACSADFESARQTTLTALETKRGDQLSTCDGKAQECAGNCNAP